jgi:WS/DGAT/MGAT family acyltransferase
MNNQLGAQDAQFLYLQAGEVLTHVMSINILAPAEARRRAVRFEDIVRHVAARSVLAPVYRQQLHRVPGDLDLPYWVEDPRADPAQHISRTRLPRPGSWPQFRRLAARRFELPMDLDRPLWDILVVDGLDGIPWIARGSRALLQRFHHAAIDGASGTHALAALFDCDARGTSAVPKGAPTGRSVGAPGTATIVARAIRSSITSPVRMADAVLRMTPALVASAARSIATGTGTRGTPPVTRFNHRITSRRSFAATQLSLEDLRAIRSRVPGATVNDVILAICGGALRAYLARHRELPTDTLVAIVPINARRPGGASEATGTDVTAMSVPLATSVADPLARLQAIRACTRAAKDAKAGLGVRVLADVSRQLPGIALPVLSRLLGGERIARSQGNLVITNVPGSATPLYMLGMRITHQFGMGPLAHGLGLFISANTYDGRVALCLTADPGLVPDLTYMCRCIDTSWRQLRVTAGIGRDR